MGWNWPGTLLLVDSLRETRVTEPPWVMFVTNLGGKHGVVEEYVVVEKGDQDKTD